MVASPSFRTPRSMERPALLLALALVLVAAPASAQSFLRRASSVPPPAPVPNASRALPAAAPRAETVVRADGAAADRSGGGVVRAGAIASDCRHCGRRGCQACRGAGAICNGRCDAGGCPAHCPVRPDQFGYYQTQWRSWPGQSVRQVSHFDPATTPVVPPRSQIPSMEKEAATGDEELPDDDGSVPDSEATTADAGAAVPAEPPVAPLPARSARPALPARPATDAPAADAVREAPADMPAAVDDGAAGDAGDGLESDGAGTTDPAPSARSVSPKGRVGTDAAAVLLPSRRVNPEAQRPSGGWRPITSPRGSSGDGVTQTTSTATTDTATEEEVAAPVTPAARTTEPTGAAGVNPLRRAPRDTSADDAARPARRIGDDEGWRPAQRQGAGTGDVPASLRGVTANPGNPLR